MALINVRERSKLAAMEVLAPERYDPRRELNTESTKTVLLGDIATLNRKVVSPSVNLGRCLVLDTSDAREGFIISRRRSVDGSDIGSVKKAVEQRCVIISRLRPYLRQVAYVDSDIPNAGESTIVCSTEFFVLRSVDEKSIAFLVPFLLSSRVQEVLAASQEGGHHPRFADSTLATLRIPLSLLSRRDEDSATVETAAKMYRRAEAAIDGLVAESERAFVMADSEHDENYE
jgi:hypothetical protein